MNITKKISVLALSVYCSVFFAADSQSKVCFLGDDNCVNDVNFGNLEEDDSDNLCVKSGYILKEECQTNGNEYIVSYCPYNSSYVACCNKVYAYDSCPPLKYVGKCWNKYKCECDDDIYKYTQEDCEATKAYPAGSSCSHIAKNSEQTSIETVIKYSSCRCDRAIYKEDIKNCEDYDSSKVCTDSDKNQYTSSCVCNRDKYPKIAWDCEYGGEGEECVEDGITYVEDCCSCSGFPLKQLEEGGYEYCIGGNCEKITKVEPCSCDHGKHMVKVVQCAAGWQPTSKRDGCERISCEAAVKLYMSEHPNRDYGLLEVINGVTSIGYYEPLTDDERNALTGDDLATATYAVSDRWKETSASTGVMAASSKQIKTGEHYYDLGYPYPVRGLGLGGTRAYTVLSGYKFGQEVGDEMVEESCKDTEQIIVLAEKEFKTQGGGSVTTKGVSVWFGANNPVNVYDLIIEDAPNIKAANVYFGDFAKITNSSENGQIGQYTGSGRSANFSFGNGLEISGYNINVTRFSVMSYSKNSTITLPAGGSMTVGSGLYYVGNTDGNLTYSSTNFGDYSLTIKSSTPNTSANLYGNVYVGVCDQCYYNGTDSKFKSGVMGGMKLVLDNVIFNLTEKQSSLYMSKGSSVTAKSNGYINTNAGQYSICSMRESQPIYSTLRNTGGTYNIQHGPYTNYTCCDFSPQQYCSASEYTSGAFSCRLDYKGDMHTLEDKYIAISKKGASFRRCSDGLGRSDYPKMEMTSDCALHAYSYIIEYGNSSNVDAYHKLMTCSN